TRRPGPSRGGRQRRIYSPAQSRSIDRRRRCEPVWHERNRNGRQGWQEGQGKTETAADEETQGRGTKEAGQSSPARVRHTKLNDRRRRRSGALTIGETITARRHAHRPPGGSPGRESF